MNYLRATMLSAVLALSTTSLGCNTGDKKRVEDLAPTSGGKTPSSMVGARCTVHFCRNLLGVGADSPIPVTSDVHNGAQLTVAGRITSVRDQWLIVEKSDKTSYWIPQMSILYLEVQGQ
jgi:hypothetical protein